MDVLYKSVVEARACLNGSGSVEWALWDIKGGVQNVHSSDVLNKVSSCEPLRMWMGWLRYFMSLREFEILWEHEVRGLAGQKSE